jgi:glycosyltransferase involved in cell wall biosynthesis
MEISLVIPAHNEAKYIKACLESVVKHARHFKEIVVVDNASTDDTAVIAARFPGVRVVHAAYKGLTRARQAGLLATTAEYVAYIDADSRLPDDWCNKARSLIARYPDAVSWSGPAKYHDAPSMLWRFQLSLGWWVSAPLMYRVVGYMLFGAGFIVRRSAIDAIGGFDPGVEFYGEDMTLAKRLHT